MFFTSIQKNITDVKLEEDLCKLVIPFQRRSPEQYYNGLILSSNGGLIKQSCSNSSGKNRKSKQLVFAPTVLLGKDHFFFRILKLTTTCINSFILTRAGLIGLSSLSLFTRVDVGNLLDFKQVNEAS